MHHSKVPAIIATFCNPWRSVLFGSTDAGSLCAACGVVSMLNWRLKWKWSAPSSCPAHRTTHGKAHRTCCSPRSGCGRSSPRLRLLSFLNRHTPLSHSPPRPPLAFPVAPTTTLSLSLSLSLSLPPPRQLPFLMRLGVVYRTRAAFSLL
jgi:hypothetical protein